MTAADHEYSSEAVPQTQDSELSVRPQKSQCVGLVGFPDARTVGTLAVRQIEHGWSSESSDIPNPLKTNHLKTFCMEPEARNHLARAATSRSPAAAESFVEGDEIGGHGEMTEGQFAFGLQE